MRNFRLYVITENGRFINPKFVEALVDALNYDGQVVTLSKGSAYNDPAYLLGEVQSDPNEAVIVAWDWEGKLPYPRALCEGEVDELMLALEKEIDGDAWEIAVRVNKRIRKKQ